MARSGGFLRLDGKGTAHRGSTTERALRTTLETYWASVQVSRLRIGPNPTRQELCDWIASMLISSLKGLAGLEPHVCARRRLTVPARWSIGPRSVSACTLWRYAREGYTPMLDAESAFSTL